ncbi:MAG: diguanylate cyclase [Candidatus Izemoplasmatales bacterium]|nr:diguanylate cyclase [Candidatus Izemoplasmatales bacterium]
MRFDFMLVALLFSVASFLIFAAVFVFTRKEILFGIKFIGLLAVDNVIYLLGQAGVIMSDQESSILLFSHIQFMGYVFIPTVWFLISSQQKRKKAKFSNKALLAFSVVPFLAIIVNFLYPWTHTTDLSWFQTLYYTSHELVYNSTFGEGFVGIVYQKGVFFYFLMSYNVIITIFSLRNYFQSKREGSITYRNSATFLIIATLCILYVLGYSLFLKTTALIEIAPLSMSLLVFIAFYGLYKYELFDLTPLAYRQVYQDASFPVFILDKDKYILSMNSEARHLYHHQFDYKERITLDMFDEYDPCFSLDLLENHEHESVFIINGKETYYLVKLEELYKFKRFMGYLVTYRDITTHKNEMKKMEIMATYDDLTQIYNRRAFFIKAADAFDDSVIHKKSVSFIMFDIDGFKEVNDIYGHQAGDFVLAEMAKTIKKEINRNTVFARYGGEEFIIFIKNLPPIDAYDFANHLRKTLENQVFVYTNHKIQISASFGVSGTDKQISKSFEHFLKDADDALYESKNNGKNQVSIKE